jgi:octaheme c-type cytochrome (tetrathionate reductase family)
MQTPHWTWEYTDPQTGEMLGKKNVINNFCQSISSNEPRCTSCHIGYGYADNTFDFTVEENVDCLACHDTTGQYKKFPSSAGHPVYEEAKEFPAGSGKMWEPVDLTYVAQNVGATSRATCGACHFNGGGDDGVKHGDLDSSLITPDYHLDVHMDVNGLNFTCSTCHAPQAHNIPGSRYQLEAKDTDGIAVPSAGEAALTCESCHGLEPHPGDQNLDDHVEKIACQTCHIPAFARGGVPTKTWWDWSTAGQKDEDGKPLIMEDETGLHTYLAKKGFFVWRENVQPEYAWFNGDIEYQNLKPFEEGTIVLPVNKVNGHPDDPSSRIWPFKVMRGKQPYDSINNTLVIPHVFGNDDTAYWGNYDWDKAITVGMEYAGAEYSGEYDFIETEMYWPITHMVAPAEDALACESCHTRNQGILEGIEGIYIPGLTKNKTLDTIGWSMSLFTLAGVTVHGLARLLSKKYYQKEDKL